MYALDSNSLPDLDGSFVSYESTLLVVASAEQTSLSCNAINIKSCASEVLCLSSFRQHFAPPFFFFFYHFYSSLWLIHCVLSVWSIMQVSDFLSTGLWTTFLLSVPSPLLCGVTCTVCNFPHPQRSVFDFPSPNPTAPMLQVSEPDSIPESVGHFATAMNPNL